MVSVDPSFFHEGVIKPPPGWDALAIALLTPPSDVHDFGNADELNRWAAHVAAVTAEAYAGRTLLPRGYAYTLAFTIGLEVLAAFLPDEGVAVATAQQLLSTQPDMVQKRREDLVIPLWMAARAELLELVAAVSEDDRARLARAVAVYTSQQHAGTRDILSRSPQQESPLSLVITVLISIIAGYADPDAFRTFVRKLYAAHESPLENLLRNSHDAESWLENVLEVLPRLLLKHFVPVYTGIQISNPGIGLVQEDGGPGDRMFSSQATQIRTVAPLIRALFTEEEVGELIDTENVTEERFANLYAAVLTDWDVRAEKIRSLVLAELAARGYIEARKLAVRYYSRLSTPQYVYDNLIQELKTAARSDRI
jgi:hypothetical protein